MRSRASGALPSPDSCGAQLPYLLRASCTVNGVTRIIFIFPPQSFPTLPSPGSAEGVVARRHDDGARCGARGRGETYPARSGGAGAPPGGTTTPFEELADGGPLACPRLEEQSPPKRGRRARAGGGAKRNVRKRGPAPIERRSWSAERRPRSRQWSAAKNYRMRLAALHSLGILSGGRLRRTPWSEGQKGTTAYPAPQRIRAITRVRVAV